MSQSDLQRTEMWIQYQPLYCQPAKEIITTWVPTKSHIIQIYATNTYIHASLKSNKRKKRIALVRVQGMYVIEDRHDALKI